MRPDDDRVQRLRAPLVVAGGVAVLAMALHLRDPHDQGSWGGCPWVALTGHYCPGCGVLRAVNDLTNGDVLGAASSNLPFVLLLPVLAVWWTVWAARAWSGSARATPDTPSGPGRSRAGSLVGSLVPGPAVLIPVAAVAMIAFTVLRNLPGSWLAP